jgi:plasmid maintenance system antidote protein VapI
MANLNIAIKIAADDKASGPIGNITKSLRGLKEGGLAGMQTAGALAMTGIVVGAGLAVAGIGLIGAAAFGVSNDVATATANIKAQLGTTSEEAERLGDIATSVWGNNFAGSITEAAGAVGLARQQLGDLADNELQRATENAFRLNDVFGVETPESINAASTLMENFGLTSDEAFDFIASGFQRGLDSSGDFLDTIGEYSTQFSNGGADAGQFFSLLESGLQGGMLGTDRAADAFKEFRVRIQDGSSTTADALAMIGISSDDLAEKMASGQVTAADAFQLVVDALGDVDDENVRMQAGVGLLGTQFEDLGTEAALGLSLIGTGLEDLAGATDTLDAKYDTLGSAAEGYKRRALLALEPIGNVLLGLANESMPMVDSAFAFFETTITPAIETAASVVQGLFNNMAEGMTPLNAIIEAIWDIAPPELLDTLVNFRDNILPGLTAQFEAIVKPVWEFLQNNVQLSDVLTALGIAVATVVVPAIGSILVAIGPVILVFAAVVAAVALVRTAWENNWGGIQEKTQAVIDFIVPLVQNGIAAIAAWWAENGDAILLKAQTIWEAVKLMIGTALTVISEGVQVFIAAVQVFWEEHGEAILTTLEAAWELIKETISNALDLIESIWEAFRLLFEGDWFAFGEALYDVWEAAWKLITDYFSGLWDMMKPWLEGLWSNLESWWNGIDWSGLGRKAIDAIVAGLQAAGGAILSMLSGLISSAIANAIGGATGGGAPAGAASGAYAAGGFTGYGAASAVAGLVHRGEYVFNAAAVRNMGVQNLEMMHRAAQRLTTGSGSGSGGMSVTLINPQFYGVQDAENLLSQLEALAI